MQFFRKVKFSSALERSQFENRSYDPVMVKVNFCERDESRRIFVRLMRRECVANTTVIRTDMSHVRQSSVGRVF